MTVHWLVRVQALLATKPYLLYTSPVRHTQLLVMKLRIYLWCAWIECGTTNYIVFHCLLMFLSVTHLCTCQQCLVLRRHLFCLCKCQKLLYICSHPSLSVALIHWGKQSCLLTHHSPSTCLSLCFSASFTDVRNRPSAPVPSCAFLSLCCPSQRSLCLSQISKRHLCALNVE